jgi:predicted DNA-binding protein
MPLKATPKEQLTVRLSIETAESLKKFANERGLTISSALALAVQKLLEEEKDETLISLEVIQKIQKRMENKMDKVLKLTKRKGKQNLGDND